MWKITKFEKEKNKVSKNMWNNYPKKNLKMYGNFKKSEKNKKLNVSKWKKKSKNEKTNYLDPEKGKY